MAQDQELQIGSAKLWHGITICSLIVFVILSLLYLILGRANADEGWYLYASRLVIRGQLPYRDFAYTQTPLLPYVYGLPQFLLRPSIYVGRVTSLLFSVANLGLCILLAKQYSGNMAASLTALLFATFTYGIYFGVIVKTYALLSFLFSLTFAVLSSRLKDGARYPLAAAIAWFAVLVRLSAIGFSAVIIVYCLFKVTWPQRYAILGLCGLIVLILLLLILPNPSSVEWNLLGHHLGQWGHLSAIERMRHILYSRIPYLMVFFLSYHLLGAAVASTIICEPTVRRKAASYVHRLPPPVLIALGLTLFAGAHLGTGGFHAEYFVPAIASLFPILAIVFAETLQCLESTDSEAPSSLSRWLRSLLHVTLATCLVLVPIRHTAASVDLRGRRLPVQEIIEVSRFVAQNTETSSRILVLQALSVSIEADRTVLPGLTMAHFSFQDVSKQEARQLHVVNDEIILGYLANRTAEAVILTDLDLQILRRSPRWDLIDQALSNGYRLELMREDFGQRAASVYVYLRAE